MDSAVLAIAQQLEDACPDVREATLSALRALDQVECSMLITALVKRIRHPDASIRLASVKALALVVEPGNAVALNAITKLLDDDDAGVRWATVEAMGRIAAPGGMTELAVDAIAQRMAMSGALLADNFDDARQDMRLPPYADEAGTWEAGLHYVGHNSMPNPRFVAGPPATAATLDQWDSPVLSDYDLRTFDTMIINQSGLNTTPVMATDPEVDSAETASEGDSDVWWEALEAMARISVPDKTNTMGAIIERLHHEAVPGSGVLRSSPQGGGAPLDPVRLPRRSGSLNLLKAMDTIQEEEDTHFDRPTLIYT